MDNKDFITITISVFAIVISIIALIISIIQKNKETKRTIRKNLTDTLEAVTKISLEFAKLEKEVSTYNTEPIIKLRRLYNSQKRILIAHADFLVTEHNDIATEIDCTVIAGTYDSIGHYENAEIFWKKAIEKSDSNVIKHMNLRGYARFLFFQGKFQLGRSKYEEALKLELSETDGNRLLITDTYYMWARVEKDFGNDAEANRLIDLAGSCAKRIGNENMKKEIQQRILTFGNNQNIKNDL